MMTDRELLKAAAKAASLDLIWWDRMQLHQFKNDPTRWWNPLIDDGDALRLAVKLGIADLGNFYDGDEADPYAATRRAIVRAAAAMADRA